MGLDKDRQISELYHLKHRFDTKLHRHYPWENNLLKNTTSPYMWRNDNMNEYLLKIESMSVLIVEQMNVARNFMNYTVDKYWDDYWG